MRNETRLLAIIGGCKYRCFIRLDRECENSMYKDKVL